MKRVCLFVLLLCSFLPVATHAQLQTGLPLNGSFNGAPDTVNVADLNVHLMIPVINKPGRGLNFVYNVTYDSAVWYPLSEGGGFLWEPVPNWGLNGTSFGYVGMATVLTTPCITSGGVGGIRQTGTVTKYAWSYIDAANTSHGFGTTTQVSGTITGTNCAGDSTTSIDAPAGDGSSYTLSATGADFQSLIGPSGQQMNIPVNAPSTANVSVEDRNGNEITSNSSSVFTDTLGTTVFTVAGNGTPTSPITLTYTAPSGASAVYTEKFTQQTVQTNFGCSNVAEYGPTSQDLISEIDLPDIAIVPNDKYTFTYEATPGHSGNVTGRIASITLPTGGTITYSYGGGSNGITCTDGITATLTRTTPDGPWTYAHTESSDWTTTVTDPQTNQSVYQFQGIYATEIQAGGQTFTVCYNSTLSNCNSNGVTTPFTSIAAYTQLPAGLGNLESETNIDYNTLGLPTEKDDYDYGSNAPGNLLRKTVITYAGLGNGIVNMPASVTVQNGSGGTIAETTYQYDQYALASLSGTPQLASISGARGNVTTITSFVNSSTNLSKTFTYYNTRNVDTATDVNGSQSLVTYNYSNATATCGNAFPSSVSEPLSLSRSMAWNCIGGVETSATDESGNTVSAAYSDAFFWRPASTTDQALNATNYSYASQNSVESSLLFNGGNSTTDYLTTLDGQGRVLVTQKRPSPTATMYDSMETDYDSLGRPSRTTVPYSGTAGQTNSSAPATTQTYDGLNRPFVTTDGGLGTATLSYTSNDTLQKVGPAPTGENTKLRQSEYNSLGQLTSVCEITAGTSTAPAGTCGQTSSATGYWTTYTHDALGDLLKVTQNAQAQASSQQPRNYTYDELGRMTSEQNPETGTINYVYDTDSTCGTSDGDLVKRTDAAGNVTCYSYDALHRNTSITYRSGPNSGNSPNKCFVYDAAIDSETVTNTKARLAEAYTTTSACSNTTLPTTVTDEAFSYTVRGEVAKVYESTPHSGGYFWVTQGYWANGVRGAETNNLGNLPGFTDGVDGEGRITTISAGTGQNPVTSTTYNVASEVTQVKFGSADFDVFGFDANTFRMTQYRFNVNSQNLTGTLTWNANGTLGKLNISDPFNATNTQQCLYSHDDLARVASANCGSVWSQTFAYDAFGNITKAGTNSFNPGYNSATNQMSTGATYDAKGDVLTDSLHSYAWDVETRPTTIDTVTATYDALGRMVEQTKAGTSTEIVYDCLGNKLALMNGTSTVVEGFAPLPGGAIAVYSSTSLGTTNKVAYYRGPDWLGSSRFSSTPSRTMYNDLAYAPFGEQYAQAGTTGVTNTSFAGNNQDTTTNLYDAQFREYEIYGRWPSPDPAGIAAANPANPQSWNRYAYALNNPLLFIDPSGLLCMITHNDGTISYSDISDDECVAEGGQVVSVGQTVTVNGNAPPPIDPTPAIFNPVLNPQPFPILSNNQPFGSGNGPASPQAPTPQQQYKQCMSSFQNSTAGKVVAFSSLFSFLDNTSSAIKEWATVFAIKGTILGSFFGGANSAAGGVSPVTAMGKSIVADAGTVGVTAATVADAEARHGCALTSTGLNLNNIGQLQLVPF